MTTQRNDYYTYAYLREDKTPYYIGKGRGRRIYAKSRVIKPPEDKSRIIFLKKNLTEEEAFKHEIYMIAIFGRKDLGTGILRNLTNGGDGVSGLIHTEEHRRKNSEARIGEKHPQFGVPKSKEWKQAMSERMSGEKAPNYGRFGSLSFNSKAIIAIEPDGTERYYGSCIEAAKDLKIARGNLSARYLKHGHILTQGPFKGWQFKRYG